MYLEDKRYVPVATRVSDSARLVPPENGKGWSRKTDPPGKIEEITRFDQLKDLEGEWNRLAERYGSPLLCHEWFSACAAAFCPPGHLHVLAFKSEGGVHAVAPLVHFRRGGVDHLEILGAAPLMEPTSLLFSGTSSFEQMFRALLDLRKPLFLERLIEEDAYGVEAQMGKTDLERALHSVATEKSFVVIENSTVSQWIPIVSSWDTFESKLKSSERCRLRRFRRRLEEKGAVTVEIRTENSADLGHALNEAFRIEASGWKAKLGTAVLANKKLEAFFTRYISAATSSGLVRLFLLKVNGAAIAMILGVEYAQRFWILKIGYDESWARYAPGILLHHESVRWAFEHQLKGYEFLGTAEAWMEVWTKNVHRYRTYRLFPKSAKGLLSFGMEATRLFTRKFSEGFARLKGRRTRNHQDEIITW